MGWEDILKRQIQRQRNLQRRQQMQRHWDNQRRQQMFQTPQEETETSQTGMKQYSIHDKRDRWETVGQYQNCCEKARKHFLENITNVEQTRKARHASLTCEEFLKTLEVAVGPNVGIIVEGSDVVITDPHVQDEITEFHREEIDAAKGALEVYDKCVEFNTPVGNRVRRLSRRKSRRLGD